MVPLALLHLCTPSGLVSTPVVLALVFDVLARLCGNGQ
jgi:hypothetical protein